MNAAILIASGKPNDATLGERKYAAEDVRGIAIALEQHGFASADRELLIDEEATKTSIESAIRTTVKRMAKDDTLFLYYAGHGFSKIGDDSYLVCRDTRKIDCEATSISLNWLFQQLQGAKCERIVLFLDASVEGFIDIAQPEMEYGPLDDAALQAFFSSSKNRVCFVACEGDGRSYVDTKQKHGVWADQLIQALDGRQKTALSAKQLTAISLQRHLESVVPTAVKRVDPNATQSPRMFCAAESNIALVDMERLFAQRAAGKHPHAGMIKDSILSAETLQSVKRLSGFNKKGHNVPDRNNSYFQSFINDIADEDLKEDAERVRAALKSEFGFTRRQLKVEHFGEGTATITTPYFSYNVSVIQAPADPTHVVWRRSIESIVDAENVLSEEFETVFTGVFDTVEMSMHSDINVEDLIDFIEDLDSDEIRVDYGEDENVSACVVRIDGYAADIKITSSTFSIVHPRATSPRQLLKSFFEIQAALSQQYRVPAITF